jgi:SpoVK/Ycf46/Vps4 family AAA+-type ATPase/intein/homing endonuclease
MAQAGGAQQQKVAAGSMSKQKVLAMAQMLRTDENIGDALLVALGTFFLIIAFPFYPLAVALALAAVAGAMAYKMPPVGTIAGMFFALPAIAYQAPVLAWVFTLAIAVTLFEAFGHWSVISFLEIAIMAPFAPFPFSLVSGFLFFLLAVAALRFGSRRSFTVSLPAIFIVLLLSTIWLLPTSSFITISNDYESIYGPAMPQLQNNALPSVELGEVVPAAAGAVASLFDFDRSIAPVSEALGKIAGNAVALLAADFAILQLAAWAVALFLCAMIPAQISHRYKQTIASSALFLVPIANLLLAPTFNNPVEPMSFFYCAMSVGAIAAMEHNGVLLSREKIVERREKQKAFGKFGDASLPDAGADSLDNVGGYEDVKAELREAIVTPLKKPEYAYAYNIKPPKGVLLFGPPGTGKTMLMRALANELDIGFRYVKCSELLSEWYGESLPYDEKIAIMEGGRVRLEEIGKVVEGKVRAKVLSFDASGKAVFADIKDYMKHRCTSPIYEVRTRTGRRIRVTGYHSLFALEGFSVKSVKTSDLKPGASYIAVPSRIPLSESPVGKLEFLRFLRDNDFGLKVRGVRQQLGEAIGKVGWRRACAMLGIRRPAYLGQVLRQNIGVRAGRFLHLMLEAGVKFDAAGAEVFAGKNGLAGEIAISEDFALFMGLWVAEGSYNAGHTVRISTSEPEAAQALALCRRLFGSASAYKKKDGSAACGKCNGRDIYIGSRALYVFMHDFLGLEDGAERKKAPQFAFSLSGRNLSAFLRGYFSGDGTVYPNQKGFGTVEASTVSRQLADHMMYLLLQQGIVATAHEKKERHGLPSHRICMAGEHMRAFAGSIGFAFGGKQARLEACLSHGNWHRGRQVPISGALAGFVSRHAPDHCKCGSIGTGMLHSLAAEAMDDAACAVAANDIHWDRVEEITRVADEEYVYDISVEPCQNFAGGFGGIFAHNSEKNLSEVFAIARKSAPFLLFFDEIDSIGKKRDAYTSDDVAPRVMSVLLQELDGFAANPKKPVIFVGATNLPDQLDPALMRPGRFDKIIYMHLPDKAARAAIFKVNLKKLPSEDDIDYDRLAATTERYSGADIKNIVTEASRLAAREAMSAGAVVKISQKHLANMIKRVKPSCSIDAIETYDKFRMDYERRTEAEEKMPDEKGVRWDDVAGLQEVRRVLLEAIEIPLLHEDLMKEMDVKPAKGLLLFGPPGCGKTMIVKAAANELNANFLTISGSELMRSRDKAPSAYVKEIFNRARESAPALIFIDEIEALAPNREEYSGGILTALLQELDGVRELKNVMIIAATNKPFALDGAILRPGRFDKILYIPPPDAPARKQIFSLQLAKFLKNVNLDRLAAATEGYSGADIASICQEVKMGLVRERLKGRPSEVTNQSVLAVVARRKPSITQKDLKEYVAFTEEYGERK